MCICPESHSVSWQDALTHPEKEACCLECGVKASSSVERIWPCPGQLWENEGGDLESTSWVPEARNLDTVRCGQASPGRTVSLAGCSQLAGFCSARRPSPATAASSCSALLSFCLRPVLELLLPGTVLLTVVCVLCLTERR